MKKGKLKILWLIIGIILATMAVLKIDISLANSAHTMTSPLTGEFTLSETSFSHNDYRLAEAQQRLYCIDSTYLIEDDYVNTYRYQFSITINGNNGVISTNTNNPVNGNRALGRFAYYVLGGDTRTYPYGFSETSGGTGQENWTVRQVAIWKNVGGLVDIFGSTVGELFKYGQNENNQRTVHSSKTSQYNAFLQEAQDYANEVQSGNTETVKAELKSNENLNCRNNSIGPIKIDFNGKISKVKVIASDESEITDIEYPTIQSNQNFYITNNSNKEVKKVEITVAPPANATATIKAKIYFYKCTATTCDWRNTATGILSQPVIFAEGTTNEPRPKTVTINVTPEKGKIQVQKSAEKYGNSTPKIKASFVLYNETLQIYPKVTGSGTSYTADNKTSVSAGNAAKIEVDGTKTVTISKLWTGYKYRLVEVSNENPFYQNPIKIDKATGPSGIEVKQVKYNKVEGFWSISKIDAQTASDPINVVVYDKRTRNNLVVRKYGIDDAGDNKEQINLHFKVYDETAKKWIKATLKEEGEDSNEVYRTRYDIDISSDDAQYASGWDSATEFVTSTKNDKIGVTQIRYLLCDHKYTVVETDVDAEYYKPLEIVKADLSGTSLSTGTTTQNNTKYYKVTGITVSNTTTKWVNIYDKKTRTDLKVEKYGLDDSNPAAQTSERINMFFKIYDKTANNGNGQWIKAEKESEDNEKIVYKVKWNDEYEGSGTNHTGATEFVTSSEEGKVKYAVIKGLIANHQYSVVETDVYDKSYKNPMELVKAEFNGNDLGALRKSNYIKAGWANGKEDGWTHSNVFKLLNTGENKVTFYDRKVRGNLEIEKFGQDDKGNQEDDIVAQFKVLDQKTGKYIAAKKVSDGNDANYYEVTSQDAGENDSNTTFETGGTGNKIILKYLLVDHKYTIIEVSNNDPYYNRDIQIKSASQDYGGTPNLTTKTVGGKTYPVVENVTVVNTYKDVANKVKIIDRKTGGDLEIVKDGVDDNGNNKDVIDATFEIYDLTTGEQVKATSVAGDGTANVYEVSENGTETQFTTGGSQHKIIMKYLLVDHQYKVVEVENDNEYYQDIDIINPEMVVGDSSGISIDNAVDKYNTTYHEAITNVPVVNYQGNSLNVHDRKTRGDLEIVKDGVDDNGNSETINATFKIQNETTGNWVIAEDEGNGTYKATGEGSEDQATLITTVNGKAKVKLLSVDCTYKLVEVSSDNEYYNREIDIRESTVTIENETTEIKLDGEEVRDGTTYHNAVTDVPVKNYTVAGLNIYDRKTAGDLEITKKASDDNENADEIDATFKIYDLTTQKWVIAELENSDNGNVYKATGEGSESQAAEITTGGSSHKARVRLLNVDHQYKVVEVRNTNEYYDRDIDIKDATVTVVSQDVNLGNEVSKYDTTYHEAVTNVPVVNYDVVNLDVHDRKTAGDLEFTKYGRYNDVTDEVIVVGFKIYNETTQEWVIANQVDGDGKANYYEATRETTTDFERATEFRTGGTENKVYVKYLNVDSKYRLVETYSENPYYSDPIDIDSATATTGEANEGTMNIDGVSFEIVSSVTIINTNTNAVRIIDNRTSGDLTLHKIDSMGNVNLQAGFKLYSEKDNAWVTQNSDGTFAYTETDPEKGTTFRTDENGNLELKCLRNTSVINTDEVYYYRIYEVEMPTGYDKTKQYNDNTDEFGYMKDDFSRQYEWVYIGKTTLTTGENTITYTMDDKKVVDHLEGKVFVDNPQGKANDYNNLYDDGEVLLDGIEVHLRDKTRNHEIIATTWTKDGGNYSYDNLDVLNDKDDDYIYYWYLKNYYVEFVYDNQTYITTVPFLDNDISNAQGDAPNEVRDGSRAIEYEFTDAELDDRNLTGTTGNLPGIATTYQGATRDSEGLAKYYDDADYRVKYINLGLKVKLEPKFTVTQNIAYVKAEINDYTYTYNYGGTSNKSQMIYAPTVRFQSKGDVTAFTRKIYPSDIVYNGEHGNLFNVNVVYRIDIQNDTAYDVKDLYKEEKMYINKVIDSYDTDRYSLNDSNWESSGDGKATYIGLNFSDGTKVADGIEGNKSEQNNESDQNNKTIYIQFKVKPEALYKLLQQPTAENFEELGLEKSPTTATVSTHHSYWVDQNYDWYDNISDKKLHKSKNYEKSAEAPYLYLTLGDSTSESRSLSGKLFEDGKVDELNGESRENERIGNGVYDENENTVENVKVELLQKDSSNPNNYVLANLYPISVSNGGEIPKAITWTSEKGKYEFKDMIPGDYYVRYTYGDGTQKICKAGNENEKLRDVSSNVYKSTIVTSQEARTALDNKEDDSKRFWYIMQGEENKYSTAVDAIDSIIAVTDDLEEVFARKQLTQGGTSTNKNIGADTARIGIPVEYLEASANGQSDGYKGTFTETRKEETTNKYGEVIEREVTVKVANDSVNNKANYSNMNFGIIEMPKTELAIGKKIVNVKITLSNGQVIVEGNPTQNVKYMTDMGTDGKYVKVELDNQYLYGSTLEIKYAITVTNNSELYYTNNEYYWYGEITDRSKDGTVKINKMYDYLDPRLEYKSVDETGINANMVPTSDETAEEKDLISAAQDKVCNAPETTRDIVYDKVLKIEGTPIAELHTTRGGSGDTEKTITINADRTLSTEDDDLDVVNLAQVVGITTTELIPAIPSDASEEQTGGLGTTPLQPRTEPIVFTITPSTGEDRSNYTYIYVIAGMVILVAGVVIIKKKVL